jgi:hypothetical protein
MARRSKGAKELIDEGVPILNHRAEETSVRGLVCFKPSCSLID